MLRKFEILREEIDFLDNKFRQASIVRARSKVAALNAIESTLAEAREQVVEAKKGLELQLSLEHVHNRNFINNFTFKSTAGSEAAKQHIVLCEKIVKRLEKAQVLVPELSVNDNMRWEAFSALYTKAMTAIQEPDSEEPEESLNVTYKALKKIKDNMNAIYATIIENEQLIKRCRRLADDYNSDRPHRFPAHWLELATVILERQDAYGFKGIIDHRDLGMKETPNTGLEAYAVAHGVFLKEGEVVSYTCPDTRIKIEQSALGKIVDHTPYDNKTTLKEKQLVAIKCAQLLLLDCILRKDMSMYIHGPASTLEQTIQVVAALRILAKRDGLALDVSNIDIKVPGWPNTAEQQKAAIEKVVPDITKMIDINTKPAYRDLWKKMKENDIDPTNIAAGEMVQMKRNRP